MGTRCARAIRGRRSNDRIPVASGWYRQWNASITTLPLSDATRATVSASVAFAVNGFSQRTCLPASSALTVHSPWSPFGSGLYTASTSGSARRAS